MAPVLVVGRSDGGLCTGECVCVFVWQEKGRGDN